MKYVSASVAPATWERRVRVTRKFEDWLIAKGAKEKTALSDEHIASFLVSQHEEGKEIDGLRTDICTILQVNTGVDWSNQVLVKRACKGASNLRPRFPKHQNMWNVTLLYEHLRKPLFGGKRPIIEARTRANITIRLSIAGRQGDVANIHLPSVKFQGDRMSIRFYQWKTKSREGTYLSREYQFVKLPAKFAYLCPVRATKKYIAVNSSNYRPGQLNLFTSYASPATVKPATLAKDVGHVMKDAGIPTEFKSSTLRHATITHWRNSGIRMEDVMRRTGHRCDALVRKFYDFSVSGYDINQVALTDSCNPADDELTDYYDSDEEKADAVLVNLEETFGANSTLESGVGVQLT